MGLKPIVVINKIDKPDARIDWVHDKTFDLFVELGADDATLDFPVVYAAAKLGKAGLVADLNTMTDITAVFESILKYVPAPKGDANEPLQMVATTVFGDTFKGRVATGRIANGTIKANQDIVHINRQGAMKKYRLVSLMTFNGLGRVDISEAYAGDIVAVSGIPDITIGETIADPQNPMALPLLSIEEPTVKVTFLVNDSPLAGREGQYSTSRQIDERLKKELESDMALRVEATTEGWIVSGRGELHLAILIERLRREGYEFQVSRPQVITKIENNKTVVPFEMVFIETPDEYSGAVIQKLGSRHGELRHMQSDNGITSLEFSLPTRGLFGYRTEFLTDTRGLGIMNSSFDGYREDSQTWKEREQGSLVAHETGTTALYGLLGVQDRGTLFVGPAVEVYKGQVVGQHSRPGDLNINVCKTKQLSNMRSKGDGSAEHFNQPRVMDLEAALEYIGDDELVEVTPQNIRIRKMVLDEMEARRKQLGIT